MFKSGHLQGIINDISKQREFLFLEQLEELTKRNVLVVEESHPVLLKICDPASGKEKIELKQTIKLKLKDQEYIESLEKENAELRGRLDKIKTAIQDVNE